jgi:hypothetical protein
LRPPIRVIAFMAVFLTILYASAAGAVEYRTNSVVGIDNRLARYRQEKVSLPNELPGSSMGWAVTKGFGRPDRYIHQIIIDENWEAWERFQKSTGAVIPMVPVFFYKVFSLATPVQSEREKTGLPPLKVTPRNISALNLMSERLTGRTQVSGGREVDPMKVGAPWSPATWLFSGDGLFSPQPWEAKNFIPRVITIMLFVLGGVILVEFIRFLVRVGSKSLGGGRRG